MKRRISDLDSLFKGAGDKDGNETGIKKQSKHVNKYLS